MSLKHKVWGYWKKWSKPVWERAKGHRAVPAQLETCWRLEGKRSNILAFPLLFSNLLPVPSMPKPSQKPANIGGAGIGQQVDTQQSKENDLWATRQNLTIHSNSRRVKTQTTHPQNLLILSVFPAFVAASNCLS